MTRTEVIAMATEAGLNSYRIAPGEAVAVWERFAALVAAKEREAWRASLEPAFRGRMGSEQVREIVQSAIRARGQKEGA